MCTYFKISSYLALCCPGVRSTSRVISVLVISPDIGFILDDNPDSDGQIVDSNFLPHLQLNYAYCLGRTASALFRNSDVPTDAHRTESLPTVSLW